jgi:hypothetical protein
LTPGSVPGTVAHMREEVINMVDVTVKVPAGRVAEFYAMVGQWLRGLSSQSGDQAGLKDWSAEDADKAEHVWSRMSDEAKKLFVLLLGATNAVAADELVKALGPDADASTVAGTFAWPARHAREVGRKRPVKGGETPQGTVYWLEPEVKAAFQRTQ